MSIYINNKTLKLQRLCLFYYRKNLDSQAIQGSFNRSAEHSFVDLLVLLTDFFLLHSLRQKSLNVKA